MQINVIQFGSFGCASTATKMIRHTNAHIKFHPSLKFLTKFPTIIQYPHSYDFMSADIFHLSLL